MIIRNIVTFRRYYDSKRPSEEGFFLTVPLVTLSLLPHLYNMEKNIIIPFLLVFACTITTSAQVKKIYAYKQASIPGNIISTEDNDIKENGVKQPEQTQNFNYWFYISVPKKEKVIITGLWINNQQYDIKTESVSNLPVKKIIYTGVDKNDTTVMVPATNNKIILISPVAKKTGDSKYALNFTRLNELVIRYSWKGKIHYTTVKKIKELAPDVRV